MANPARALVQRDSAKPAGTIDWSEHEQAWLGYAKRFPGSARDQDAARIHERGGFSYLELVEFLGHDPTSWLPS